MHDIEKKQVESGGLTTSLNFFFLVRRPPAPARAPVTSIHHRRVVNFRFRP